MGGHLCAAARAEAMTALTPMDPGVVIVSKYRPREWADKEGEMIPRIWVVEILMTDSGKWEPTVGVGVSRKEARIELAKWKKQNWPDRFRIGQYVRKP